MGARWLILAVVLVGSGCATVCDEVADEAEASGCAQGVLPETGGGTSTESLTECSGVREARAQCLLDLTENVCSQTEEEAAALKACYAAAESSQGE